MLCYNYTKIVATFIFIVVSGILLPVNTGAQKKKKPLSNADIVRMTKKGLGENIIIRAIETSENQFETSADDLIQLSDEGVSQKVIEAMQKASTDTIKARDNSTGKAESPTKRRFEFAFFTAELDGCLISGKTVACSFTVTNKGQDRSLGLSSYNSGLIDDAGNQLRATYVTLANDKGDNAERYIVTDTPVKAWVVLEDVSPSAKKLALLYVNFFVRHGGVSIDDHPIQIRDITLEKTK